MTSQVKIDAAAVRALAELLRETDLTEIEYQVDSLKIKVLRSLSIAPAVSQQSICVNEVVPAQISNAASASLSKAVDSLFDHPGVIEAQMVGTVYLSPGPGSAQFVNVGDKVTQGQTLFIIEAMKVMNMIRAPKSGVVKHIFIKDSQPVEYGDPILVID